MSKSPLHWAEQFHNIYIRINPQEIAFLKFIIEGYDGLALVTTVDRRDGLVRLLVPITRHDELWRLIEELACSRHLFFPHV